MIVSVNEERMDIKHRVAIVMENLHELGGEANTRDVTRRSGLEDWEVREAAKQAEARGLMEARGYDSASYGPGSDPRLYKLTGTGRQVVQRGVTGKVITLNTETDAKVPEQELNDIRETISRLERQVSRAQNAEFKERFEEFRQRLDTDGGLSNEEVEELRADFADFEEYVYEWNEAVETYLYALRDVVERELGVDLDEEMETVSAD